MKSVKDINELFNHTKNNCIHCSACTKNCFFLNKYNLDLAEFTSKPELAYSCSLCDKCNFVCPKDLSGKFISLKHRSSQKKDYLRAKFLKGNYIFKNIPKKYSDTLLFLGCNYPGYYPLTSLKLIEICTTFRITYSIDCCKKPIVETGAEYDFKKLEKSFIEKGIKKIICVCPNCYHLFLKEMKNIKIINIYEFLRLNNLGYKISEKPNIFFPCSDRYNHKIFNDIKYFLANGYIDKFKKVNCCGLGGGASRHEPEMLKATSNLIHEINADNIYTYCSSCSGIFNKYNLKNIKNLLSEILKVNEEVSNEYLKNVTKFKLKKY